MLTSTAIRSAEWRKTKKKQKRQLQEQKLQILVSQRSNSPLVKALTVRLRQENAGFGHPKNRFNSVHLAQSRRIQQDIRQMKQVLNGLVKSAEAERWLAAPNQLLNGSSPLESIRQGKAGQVKELVERLEQGIYV